MAAHDLTDADRARLRHLVRAGTAALLNLWDHSREIEGITKATYCDLTGVFETFAASAPETMDDLTDAQVDDMIDVILSAERDE